MRLPEKGTALPSPTENVLLLTVIEMVPSVSPARVLAPEQPVIDRLEKPNAALATMIVAPSMNVLRVIPTVSMEASF